MRFGVTQEDVGALAGVSGKTVSRVLSNAPNVSKATRERVEAAIRETGFQPNFAARSLAAAKSFLIGMFVPNYSSLYHADLYRGAAAAAAEFGYHLLLEQYDEQQSGGALDRYEQSLSRTRCDGVILPPPLSNDAALIARLRDDKLAIILIAPVSAPEGILSVMAEQTQGIECLLDHLWPLGHRQFGLCAPPTDRPFLQKRNEAFIAAVIRRGGSTSDVRVAEFLWAGTGVLSGRLAGQGLLAGCDRPSAIFAFNDEYAHGVMISAREMGLTIPDDLSVAGFDDGAAAQFAWPSLTTVRQPLDQMAAEAVKLIACGGNSSNFAVKLIVRESTARLKI